jgi:hypothetical protein
MSARTCRWAVALGVTLCALATASSAAAATLTVTPFGCRASVTRVSLLNTTNPVEPYIANPRTTPCATDNQSVGAAQVPSVNNSQIQAGPIGAFTFSSFSSSGASAPGAVAVAATDGVTIPTSSGLIVIAGPIQAQASYGCVNNQTVATAASTLSVITVNGSRMTFTPGQPQTIPLGSGSYIDVNEKTSTSTSLTERVLHVHLAGLADIVVGEAEVTKAAANPCAGTTGTPPVLEICPSGSTLNVATQRCEIHACGKTIVVSRPFKGPTGGIVVALCKAQKYKTPCLKGKGSKYLIVATKQGAWVGGTLQSDRILGLAKYQRIAGLGGDDCIEARAGHATVLDGNGNDRLYTGPGFSRIAAGNGNDYVNGRNGGDYITLGNGKDTVYGGTGNDRIAVGIGRDHIYGGRGKNRIFAAASKTFVNCGPGGNNTAFLRKHAAVYGAKHGCNHVHLLQ